MTSLVLGVDPGANQTGLVVAHEDRLLLHALVERAEGQNDPSYIAAVLSQATELARYWSPAGHPVDAVVSEAVNVPKRYIDGVLQPISPKSVMGTSLVLGAVMAWSIVAPVGFVLVAPAGFGKGPRSAYPAELWGAREGAKGTGKLQHCRSAWDIAQAGQKTLHTQRLAAGA